MKGRAISFGSFSLLAEQRQGAIDRPGLAASRRRRIQSEDADERLRRAPGDGDGGHRYIVTVPGRGYSFVAPIRREEPSQTPAPTVASMPAHNLPFAATRMIGREESEAAVVSQLSQQRLVTIIGPGGIGKTTVALATAARMIVAYEHGVWLVDLAPLHDARLVPSTIANVLGLETRTEDPLSGLVAAFSPDYA